MKLLPTDRLWFCDFWYPIQHVSSGSVSFWLWLEHFHFSLSCIGEGNGNPLQCSCLGNPRDGGAWWAAVYGVAQSQTRLKRLSSSSSSSGFQMLPGAKSGNSDPCWNLYPSSRENSLFMPVPRMNCLEKKYIVYEETFVCTFMKHS